MKATKKTDALSLIDRANANRWLYLSFAETAELFGFGCGAITKFVNLGAPTVARKINPDHLKQWLAANGDKVGKIRAE